MQLIQQWKLLENTRKLELLILKKIRYEFFLWARRSQPFFCRGGRVLGGCHYSEFDWQCIKTKCDGRKEKGNVGKYIEVRFVSFP